MDKFFTNEQVSLNKDVNNSSKIEETSLDNLRNVYELDRCAQWIRINKFKKVCLQFPDYLLPDSVKISFELQGMLDQTVYIMGDTAYESCCIDFVTAEHVEADSIIHFGSICFSQSGNKLPYLNIYEKHEIDIDQFMKILKRFLDDKENTLCFILVDTPFIHKIDKISNCGLANSKILALDEEINFAENGLFVYLGNNRRKLENISFSLNDQFLYQYNPSSTNPEIVNFKENPVVLKRRYYLSEKIKDSQTFGIVMGTLAVDNYMKILGRIKKILKLNRKKYYVISVGKISVAKLANFPEMDIFVVITCAMNEVYESKEFYKPLVTPYDIERAFNSEAANLRFTYDYNGFLNKVAAEEDLKPCSEPDVSLLTGNIRSNKIENEESLPEDGSVALKSDGALVQSTNFGAGYLAERSWQGLEQNLGKTEVTLAKEGRSGIAQCYSSERSDKENS